MKDIMKSKTMTLKEVAKAIGASYRTIADYAQRAGWTENGKKTVLDERQVTIILEAMKTANNNQASLASSLQGTETSQSLELQIALAERKSRELWQRWALEQEGRAMKAEWLLEKRTAGLETIQRIAEAGGLVLSDYDDLIAPYKRRA